MLAKAILVGRVSSAPVLRRTSSGIPVLNIRLACWYRRNQENRTDWYTVVVFRERAERLYSSVKEGDLLLAVGRLQQSSYTRADGSTGWNVEVIADTVRILSQQEQFSEPPTAVEGVREEIVPEDEFEVEPGPEENETVEFAEEVEDF